MLDIIFDFLGCGFVLASGLLALAGVVKLGVLLWQMIFRRKNNGRIDCKSRAVGKRQRIIVLFVSMLVIIQEGNKK